MRSSSNQSQAKGHCEEENSSAVTLAGHWVKDGGEGTEQMNTKSSHARNRSFACNTFLNGNTSPGIHLSLHDSLEETEK